MHKAAIQLDGQRQIRLRQLLPVSFAPFNEKYLFLAQFLFHPFRHSVNLIPYRGGVDCSSDRQQMFAHNVRLTLLFPGKKVVNSMQR
jgi:hypothetical protein